MDLVRDRMKFRLTVSECIRGDRAWSIIHEANMFNQEPPEGQEYLLTRLQLEYLEGPAGSVLELNYWDFSVVSRGKIGDAQWMVVLSWPRFEASLLPGAMTDGWITWLVDRDDPAPVLVLWKESWDKGAGGTYFATCSSR